MHNWVFTKDLKEKVSFTERCVLELCFSLPNKGKGYCVAMDNYFSTKKLAKILRANGIGMVGTVKPDAGEGRVPKPIRMGTDEAKKYQHNSMGYFGEKNGACVMTWGDNTRVHLMPTVTSPDEWVEKVRHRPSRPSASVKAAFAGVHEKTMPYPKTAMVYCGKMGGCDLAD